MFSNSAKSGYCVKTIFHGDDTLADGFLDKKESPNLLFDFAQLSLDRSKYIWAQFTPLF